MRYILFNYFPSQFVSREYWSNNLLHIGIYILYVYLWYGNREEQFQDMIASMVRVLVMPLDIAGFVGLMGFPKGKATAPICASWESGKIVEIALQDSSHQLGVQSCSNRQGGRFYVVPSTRFSAGNFSRYAVICVLILFLIYGDIHSLLRSNDSVISIHIW